MSELKAFVARKIDDGACDPVPCIEVYLKSEADKVIAELKKKIEEQKRLRDMALASVPNALKVAKIIQHSKYKRCLAMAKWCHSMWILLRDENETKKSVFYWRWWNIWYELAEQFKGGK